MLGTEGVVEGCAGKGVRPRTRVPWSLPRTRHQSVPLVRLTVRAQPLERITAEWAADTQREGAVVDGYTGARVAEEFAAADRLLSQLLVLLASWVCLHCWRRSLGVEDWLENMVEESAALRRLVNEAVLAKGYLQHGLEESAVIGPLAIEAVPAKECVQRALEEAAAAKRMVTQHLLAVGRSAPHTE